MREMVDALRRGDEHETLPELLFGLACCLGGAACLIWLIAFAADVAGGWR